MMKRLLSVLLSTAMLLCAFLPFNAFAADSGQVGDDISYSITSNGTLSLTGTGATYDFTPISQPWADSYNQIKKVVVSDGITAIGENLFCNLTSATSFSLPDTLTAIGARGFYNVTKITEVRIPRAVTKIGDYAFLGDDNLSKVHFDDMTGTLSLGVGVFVMCPKLKSASFPVNTMFSEYAVGYAESDGILDDDFTLYGQSGSPAYYYAQSEGINFVDSVPLEFNSDYGGKFVRYEDVQWYSFTPLYTGDYRFYSISSIDDKVTLYASDKSTVVAQNDDKNPNDLNFDLTAQLDAGQTYYYFVENVHRTGVFKCRICPVGIKSVTASLPEGFTLTQGVDSEYAMDENLDTYDYYDMSKYFDEIKISVTYNSGFVDSFYYNDKEYYGVSFELSDSQEATHWVDGTNYMTLNYGSISTDVAVNIHVHSYIITSHTAPDCTHDGVDVYTCSCGDSYQTVLKATGHSTATMYVASTCTEGGYIYEYCSVCNEQLTETEIYYPMGHSYVIKDEVKATPSDDGYTVYSCANCGKSYTVINPHTGYKVSLSAVIMQTPNGGHKDNLPFSIYTMFVDGKSYNAGDDGSFSIYLNNGQHRLSLSNNLGPSRDIDITVNNSDIDLGNVPLVIFDLNDDGYVNSRDYLLFSDMFGCKDGDDDYVTDFDTDNNGIIDKDDFKDMPNFYLTGCIDSSIYGEEN